MLCFSTSMTSASMWGHYADRHKGVCLIFDFPCVTEMLPITSRTDTIRSYVIGKYENLKNSPDPKLLIFLSYTPPKGLPVFKDMHTMPLEAMILGN